MHITKEEIDDQNALLKINLEPNDYSKQYDNALKTYRKQVSLPGFRAGKVPMSLVKQRYGRSLLAEELNKLLNENIQKYISENKLEVLGSPIPSQDHKEQGDWDNPADFEFVYELGLAPDLDVKITKKDKFEYHPIIIEDKMLDEQINNIARRYGKMSEATTAAANDMVVGDFVELDEKDEIKEGGIMHEGTISLEFIDKDEQKNLIGKKVGEDVVLDPHNVSRGHDDLAKMLGITHEETHDINTNFKFIVREIKHLEPAEMNAEFFSKIFGEGEVKDEKGFREKIREDLAKGFNADSDRLFKRDITKKLIADYNPSLPDAFLKKWILMTNEKPVTPEEVEKDYGQYQKSLQWQLIFNKLVESKAIKIEDDEVVKRTMEMMASQYAQYGMPAPEEQELKETALRVLANQDESRKVFDMLYDEKLVAYIRETATVKEKPVTYDEIAEMASQA